MIPTKNSTSTRSSVAALTAMIMASGASTTQAAETPAGASDAPTLLPEVSVQTQRIREVSSPKFTAPLVDTPQTIAVIPKEIFQQQGAASLADVLGNTPGITFLAGEGGHVSGSNSFMLRGFDASGSIFIDGVRDNGNYGRDIYNLEQVEVVKGPAGDNGRGSAGGYLNLSTKTPQADSFGSVTSSYGFDEYASVDRFRSTLDVNQSLDSAVKGAAVRLNALWQDGGVAGRDHTEKNTWGLAPSLALGLGTPTRLTLGYEHNEQDDRPDYGALAGTLSGTATAVRPSQPVDRSRFYGVIEDFDRVNTDAVTARVEHDLTPTLRLSHHARFNNTDRDAIYTVPGAFDVRPDMDTGEVTELVTTNRQAFFREIETLSNQTNLAAQFSTGRVDHSFAAGLEFIREKGRTLRDWTGLGITGELSKRVDVTAAGAPTTPTAVYGTDPYQPRPDRGVAAFDPVYRFVDDIKIDTAALYVFDTVRFNERWQATGGLRLERYEASYDILDLSTNTATPFTAKDTMLTGKLGFVFKPAREGSLYASWGVAAQPPGTNNLSNDNGSRNNATPGTTGQNSPNAKPAESFNYEIGLKWDFFQRQLTTSLAVFRSERTNISVATDTSGIPSAYGNQTVQGLELGASGRITRDWIVFGGFSFLDSENHNSENPLQDGSELNWTPRYSGNLWTTYRLPIGLTFGIGTQYTGTSRVSLNNTSEAELPARWIANAMASYAINRQLSVRLNVTNLTDKFYARAINNNSNRAYFGDPRAFLISADYKF